MQVTRMNFKISFLKMKRVFLLIKAFFPCFIVVLQINRCKVHHLLPDLSFLQKTYKNQLSACDTSKLKVLSYLFKSYRHLKKGIAKRGFHFCVLNILTILKLNSKSKVKISTQKFHRVTQAEIMNHTLLELLEVRSE